MNIKKLYRTILKASTKMIGIRATKEWDARIRFRRKLNLNDPSTLADKICYMELYQENKLKIQCSDKYAVRSYVKEKGLEHILVPLCGGPYEHIGEVDLASLPSAFVLKASHGCAMNIICNDKEKLDIEQTKKTLLQWFQEDYDRACIEPHYKKIPHRVICEEMLQDAESIIDYKFHCFYGKPDFILACGNRIHGVQKKVYTLGWEPLDVMVGKEKGTYEFERPAELEQMIEISKILSRDFDFVRVDLYDIKGKIYFGELTFSPAAGIFPNFSQEFVAEKGKLLHL